MLNYEIYEHRLENGLRVVALEDPVVPSVATTMVYGVGSGDEKPGATGWAHLAEHLMFQGSRDVAKGEHDWLIQAHGGVCNGATHADFTQYNSQVPAGALEIALWLEANKLISLGETLAETAVDKQRAIIEQERRQRFGGPFGSASERLLAALFSGAHPYRHSPAGSPEDLAAARIEDIRRFLSSHYRLDNAVLAVVGDVAPDQVFTAAEHYFAAIPAGSPLSARPAEPVTPLSEPTREDVTAAGAPFPVLCLGFRLPPNSVTDNEIFAADAALTILGGGPASRAFHRLALTEGTASNVGVGVDPRLMASIGTIEAHLISGAPVAAAEEALLEELDLLAEKGPTQAELDRWRATTEREALTALAPLQGRADSLAHFTLAFSAPAALNTYIDRIRSIDADHVQCTADRWLRPTSRATIAFHPAATPNA